MSFLHIKELLDQKHDQYNQPSFVATDPIQVPHSFSAREDIEISAFLTASIAWGQRKTIISNAQKLMQLMGNQPFDFVMNANKNQLQRLDNFKHRTFNSSDLLFFIHSLKNIYAQHGGLKTVFENAYSQTHSIKESLVHFRTIFFEPQHLPRTTKHISDVSKNSTAKRLNMMLMWLVRNDRRGVHFGLWDKIPMSALFLPLDVHTGNISRKLQLLQRTQNDWRAVDEITTVLRTFDANDPVKYDFSLFCLGVVEKF